MRKNLFKLKETLFGWLIPPKIKSLLIQLQYVIKKKHKLHWSYTPIDTGLHELKNFASYRQKPLWLSLNKEVRPAIITNSSQSLKINLEQKSITDIQFGLGLSERELSGKILIYINNKVVSTIIDIPRGFWHDIRIPLSISNNQFELKIESQTDVPLYLSHPILIRNQLNIEGKDILPNIICIVIDGITHKYLSQEKTPNIFKFFDKGIFCKNVFSQGDWTLPTFSSMMTGLYPSKHGIYDPGQFVSSLDAGFETLPNILRNNGYRTFGYSGHFRFSPTYGHAKGFERMLYKPLTLQDYYVQEINEAIQHLEAHRKEPNFVFLHFFDTHMPFKPTGYLNNIIMKSSRHYNAYKRDGYSNFVDDERRAKLYELDFALNSFFTYIQSQSWAKNATVVLTADHGISDLPKARPLLLYNRINIPLMVRGSQINQKQDASFIEGSVDLMPSILHIAGINQPNDIDGRPWPFLGGESREHIFSESLYCTNYEATIRNDNRSYHFKCPFDQKSKIAFYQRKEPLMIFQRIGDRDIKENIALEDNNLETISQQFGNYLKTANILKV